MPIKKILLEVTEAQLQGHLTATFNDVKRTFRTETNVYQGHVTETKSWCI